MKREDYNTLDVYLASFLFLAGFPPEHLMEKEKVAFYFELSPELVAAISAYHAGEMVEVNRFVNTVKMLKSRVFAMKREFARRIEGGTPSEA